MAGCVNRMHIIGNLGQDPEVRTMQDGRSVCSLRVATTDSWKDRQTGEPQSKTEWHSVSIFNEQIVKYAQQYLKKGAKVWICGPLKTRKWQDNKGNDRYATEVVLQNFNGELTLLDKAPERTESAPANKIPARKDWGEETADSISWLDD